MKRFLWILILGLMASFSGGSFAIDKNTALIAEQKNVIKLIMELYKVKPESFEAGEFDGQGYSTKKHGAMLALFFDDKILKKGKKRSSLNNDFEYVLPLRYPKFPDPNELLAENRSEPLPKIRILTPEIDNDRAKVLVKISDDSLCHYFLRKLPQGWRIYKVRSFDSPPNNLYFLKHDIDRMDEYPSGQFLPSNKEDMKLSEW